MQEFILIRGIPGSGKSTLAKELKTMNRPYNYASHFEADMYFTDSMTGEYKFDPKKLSQAHDWCLGLTGTTLGMGYDVIVSNTFTTLKELTPYFEIAQDFNLKPQVILCQNNYGSIHNVPDEALQRMKNRFQYDVTPLFDKYFPK